MQTVGISILNGLFLVEARISGARFDTTLTLGKMGCFLSPRDLRRLAEALVRVDPLAVGAMGPQFQDIWIDSLFHWALSVSMRSTSAVSRLRN
jgi:hypothetical protein